MTETTTRDRIRAFQAENVRLRRSLEIANAKIAAMERREEAEVRADVSSRLDGNPQPPLITRPTR